MYQSPTTAHRRTAAALDNRTAAAPRPSPRQVRYPPEWVYDPDAPTPTVELAPVPLASTWAAMEEARGTELTHSRTHSLCSPAPGLAL